MDPVGKTCRRIPMGGWSKGPGRLDRIRGSVDGYLVLRTWNAGWDYSLEGVSAFMSGLFRAEGWDPEEVWPESA